MHGQQSELLELTPGYDCLPGCLPVWWHAQVMSFLSGVPLTEAGNHMKKLSEVQRNVGKRLIMSRISEAYGRMILGTGAGPACMQHAA